MNSFHFFHVIHTETVCFKTEQRTKIINNNNFKISTKNNQLVFYFIFKFTIFLFMDGSISHLNGIHF